MKWKRVESARRRARFILAITLLVISLAVVVWVVFAPSFQQPCFGCRTTVLTINGLELSRDATGIPINNILLVVGVLGVLVGFAWMWRIYRAPTRFEGAHWRFRDH